MDTIKFKKLVCLFLFFSSCTLNAQTRTITVSPFKYLCYGAYNKSLCLLSHDSSLEYIHGFEFEWGYFYSLEVTMTEIERPPADASSLEFSLVKVLAKMPVGKEHTFPLRLEPDRYQGPGEQESSFSTINDSVYVYLDDVEIEVPSSLRDEFQNMLKTRTNKEGTFQHVNGKRILLINLKPVD